MKTQRLRDLLLLSRILVAPESPSPRFNVIDYRFRIPEFEKLFLTEVLVWLVDSFTISVIVVVDTENRRDVHLPHRPFSSGTKCRI